MVKLIKNTLLITLIVIGLSFVAATTWLRSGPISDERLSQLLEESLSTADGSVVANIESASLNWQDWRELGTVSVSRVSLTDRAGNIFASFAKLRVRLDPLAWVFGGQKFSELVMLRPQLYLQRNAQDQWRLGLGGENSVASLEKLFAAPGANEGESGSANIAAFPFERVIAENAQIYVNDSENNTLISSNDSNIVISMRDSAFEAQLEAPFQFKEQTKRMFVGAVMTANKQKTKGEVFIKNAPLALICEVVECAEGVSLQGVFTGRISPSFNDFMLQSADIDGIARRVNVTVPDVFEETLKITEARVVAGLDTANTSITLHEFVVHNDDLSASVSGQIFSGEAGESADIKAELLSALAIENLHKYWPISMAPDTRSWAIKNLSKGSVPEANIHVTIHPNDLDAEHIPDEMLASSVSIKDMQVQFLPNFPPLKSVDGVVHFTGATLQVEAPKAQFLTNTAVGAAKLKIDDLFHPNVPMLAKLTFDASAADAVTLLSQKQFTFDDRLALDAGTITGRVKGSSSFAFDAYRPGKTSDEPELDNVFYELELALQNISQPQFLTLFDLSQLNGRISASPGNAKLKGSTLADGNLMNVGFLQRNNGAFNIQLKGSLPVNVLAEPLKEKARWFESGTLGADVDFAYGKAGVRLNHANFDLTDAAMSVAEINLQKPAGTQAAIRLKNTKRETGFDSLALQIDLGKLHASGSLALSVGGALQEVNLQSFTMPGTDVQLRYEALENGDWVTVSGKNLDVHSFYAAEDNGGAGDFPSVKLSLNLDTLTLVESHPFHHVQGVLDCLERCSYADLSADLGDSHVSVNILTPAEGNRLLTLTTPDAGEFLKAVNLTDRVFGGTLDLKGEYQDNLPDSPLKARAILQSFTLKNSQIFARLFSVGSLTGLSNLLTGNGIAFEKFSADIETKKGVITLSKGRARGNAMGFTAEGTVDMNKADLNIKGVLVPAFLLNSLVGNIPIIGELAGGEGEGIIALNYSVTGNYADPEVFVNPLSGLTPGFLRNIFNVFDAPKKTPETSEPEAHKETPEKPSPISEKSNIIR